MKKIITSVITILGLAVFAVPALAATTATLTPSANVVSVGQTFTVRIAVNPQGSANYAEKVEIKYPAGILEVRGFTFDTAWMAMNQPGYDLTDNVNGVLVKTAGYPAGFTSAVTFGTITFYAKTAGTATISVGANSTAFDSSTQTPLTGAGVTVTVGATTPVTAIVPVQTTPVPVVAETSPVASPAAAVPDTSGSSTDLTAAVGDETSGGSAMFYTLFAILVLAVIGGGLYMVQRGK